MAKVLVDWEDATYLQAILDKSKSRADALRNMGYYDKSAISRKKLNRAIEKFDLDTSCFTSRTDRWDVLSEVISRCFSWADVLRAVGLSDQGDNHKTAKRYVDKMNLDISHFHSEKGYAQVPNREAGSQPQYTYDEVFCKNSKVTRHTVRRYIERDNLLEYKCSKCGLEDEWMGRPLRLQLEHKNGTNNDNRIHNLEFICPNCHTQTPTYAGRNRR